MVRSFLYVLLLFTSCLFFTAHRVLGSDPPSFYIETVVAGNGGAPFIAVDDAGRPWIGYWVQGNGFEGTMHFAVRDAGAWSFETVPFPTQPPVDIIIDWAGSPASAYSDGLVLKYLYKFEGAWTTETIGGFGPNASALAADNAGIPLAAYVWSYHYLGYITVSRKIGGKWVCQSQCESMYWFNPYDAGVDLTIDRAGYMHMCVNPIFLEFYYGDGTGLETIDYSPSDFAITADSESRPMISYTSGGKLRLALKDISGWSSVIIADADDCSKTDLVVDAYDIPHIIYCHRPAGVKKVFHAFRTIPFDTWMIHEIDDGQAASIAVDNKGYLHIAYIRQVSSPQGYDLKYATDAISTPVKTESWGAIKGLHVPKQKDD